MHFPANVFHEITGITDALKKNAHDQNEQTILSDASIIILSDIDECSYEAYVCHSNASCENTVGGYSCKCQEGFSGSGKNCSGKNFNSCLIKKCLLIRDAFFLQR